MSTDFFQRQESARRSTAWLIGMFALAVLGIVGATFLIAVVVINTQQGSIDSINPEQFPWQIPLGAGGASLALIGGGSLFKVALLRSSGGTGVAESLGGKRLYPGAVDPEERKLLNVVEEMAIASGTPVPPVFLMEEAGINAFAAGYSPSDAVVGVTRGCVQSLSRDELQGVVAHEFSHILNGDMRMSIRLIGILHGILLLGLIGRILLRMVFHSGSHIDSRRNNGGDSGKGGGGVLVFLALAVALVIIGSIGSLVGGLIKSAVSRQREYLADASAVQFTRNPKGISGALKRIAANSSSSRMQHPRASEMSHMYFAQGVWEGLSSLMATHPPLNKRILAIEPTWNGSLTKSNASTNTIVTDSRASGFASSGNYVNDSVPLEVVANAIDQVGEPEERHREYAREILKSLPSELVAAARDPYGARALLYGLLLDEDRNVRQKQYEELRELADGGVVRLMLKLLPQLDQLESRYRLPLIDLTLPALSALSLPQYQRFARNFRSLVLADERLSLFEWVLSQLLMRHLRPKFERVRSPRVEYYALGQLADECSVVLSALAYSGSNPEEAFASAAEKLPDLPVRKLALKDCQLEQLRIALATLATVTAKHRGRVVDAAAAAICSDNQVDVAEAELLRGIADLLDCPMPPLLPGQQLSE